MNPEQPFTPDAARRYIMSLVAYLDDTDSAGAYLVKQLIMEMTLKHDPHNPPDAMYLTLSDMSTEVELAARRLTSMRWPHPDNAGWRIRPFVIELEREIENEHGLFDVSSVVISPTRWWFAFMEGKADSLMGSEEA